MEFPSTSGPNYSSHKPQLDSLDAEDGRKPGAKALKQRRKKRRRGQRYEPGASAMSFTSSKQAMCSGTDSAAQRRVHPPYPGGRGQRSWTRTLAGRSGRRCPTSCQKPRCSIGEGRGGAGGRNNNTLSCKRHVFSPDSSEQLWRIKVG